jgi:hypothetical protein
VYNRAAFAPTHWAITVFAVFIAYAVFIAAVWAKYISIANVSIVSGAAAIAAHAHKAAFGSVDHNHSGVSCLCHG